MTLRAVAMQPMNRRHRSTTRRAYLFVEHIDIEDKSRIGCSGGPTSGSADDLESSGLLRAGDGIEPVD